MQYNAFRAGLSTNLVNNIDKIIDMASTGNSDKRIDAIIRFVDWYVMFWWIKYREYEIPPIKTNGLNLSSLNLAVTEDKILNKRMKLVKTFKGKNNDWWKKR